MGFLEIYKVFTDGLVVLPGRGPLLRIEVRVVSMAALRYARH